MSDGRRVRTTEHATIEWPTVVVGIAVYATWFGVVFSFNRMPVALAILALGLATAWHSSFQHELIHGHPFRNKKLNNALGWLPLGLWAPYELYRVSHLKHHRNEILTDPFDDPESWYRARLDWLNMPAALRVLLWVNRTMIGRLVIGPWIAIASFMRSEWREVRTGDNDRVQVWGLHLPLAVALVAVAVVVAEIPLWAFLIGDLWVGTAFILMRSFIEHRWIDATSPRSAIVRAGAGWRLLYLNNNLHHTHHQRPGAPWYRLPALAAELRSDRDAARGAGVYSGYHDVFRRFALKPFCQPMHPSDGVMDEWRIDGAPSPARRSVH